MIWEVAKEEEGQRLDKYLSEQKDHDFSRSYLGKCIQEGCVSVNGEKASTKTMIFWWSIKKGEWLYTLQRDITAVHW